jgi:hypothetical protein
LTVIDGPVYPLPGLVIDNAWIVPAIETVAVTAADTGSVAPEKTKASKDESTS